MKDVLSVAVVMYRLKGSRDPPASGTPEEYVKLYSECWDEDPNNRPACEHVYQRLTRCKEINDANRLLELEPNNASSLRMRGSAYWGLHQNNNALISCPLLGATKVDL